MSFLNTSGYFLTQGEKFNDVHSFVIMNQIEPSTKDIFEILARRTDVNFKNSQSCPFDKSHFQWDKVSKGGVLVLTSPSLNKKRAADGITIGRDICE